MEFGFTLATRGPQSKPDAILTIVSHGKDLGFDIVSVSDHIVIPKEIDSVYPYNYSGEFTTRASGECLEQLTTLAFVASQSGHLKLLTSVMVLPHRNPILAAKILATLDVLSGGRLYVGCGTGWMREEFEAIGAPSYDDRGVVSSEYIEAFKELWTSDTPSFQGQYSNFSSITFMPKPVQKPHPPIWIGGESPPALRRAALLGDAWFPIGSNPRFPVGTVSEMKTFLSRLGKLAKANGRDPSEIDVAYQADWYSDPERQFTSDGERRSFTGYPESIARDIRDFENIGVNHLMLNFQSDTLTQTLKRMEAFAASVRPLV